jgi:hypothetical protein
MTFRVIAPLNNTFSAAAAKKERDRTMTHVSDGTQRITSANHAFANMHPCRL